MFIFIFGFIALLIVIGRFVTRDWGTGVIWSIKAVLILAAIGFALFILLLGYFLLK